MEAEAVRMLWYMRGGLTPDDFANLTFRQRNQISELIKNNLETTKKSGLPFF